MAKMSNKDWYLKHNPINPKAYFLLTDPVTKKTVHLTLEEIDGTVVVTNASVNRIVSGKATWHQDFQYLTTHVVAVFNNSYYDIASTIKTLDSASPTEGVNRYDIITIKLSSDGTSAYVNVIKGQEAEHPAVPTVPISDIELVLSTVRISGGSVAPDGVSKVLLYDENAGEPTEFAVSENSGGSGLRVDNTEHPNTNAKNIKVNYVLLNPTDIVTMSSSVDYSPSSFSSLDFFVYIGTDISAIADNQDPLNHVLITLHNGANQIGSSVKLRNGVYGLNANLTGTYQAISIPLSDFGISSAGVSQIPDYILNKITLGFSGTFGTELFLDTFNLTSGVENPPTYENTLLSLSDVFDTTYIGKDGFSLVARGRGASFERTALLTDLYRGSKVIVGDYSHVLNSLQTYDAWASLYTINGIVYANENDFVSAQVTLDPPPTGANEERIDVIVVKVDRTTIPATKTIVVIKGTVGVSHVEKPSIDLLTEAEISFVKLKQNETTPADVTSSIVYDENVEWTNILASVGVDLDYADAPYSGAKNVYFPKNSLNQKAEVAWQTGVPILYTSDTKVLVPIFINNPIRDDMSIEIRLKDGATVEGAIVLNSKNIYNYGFNPYTKTGWSVLSIPITDFAQSSIVWTQFDTIEIKIANTSFGKLDLITIQSGLSKPPIGGSVQRTSQLINDGENGIDPFITSTTIDDGDMQLFKGTGNTGVGVEINDVRIGWFTPTRWVTAIFLDTLSDGDLTNENNYLFLTDKTIS